MTSGPSRLARRTTRASKPSRFLSTLDVDRRRSEDTRTKVQSCGGRRAKNGTEQESNVTKLSRVWKCQLNQICYPGFVGAVMIGLVVCMVLKPDTRCTRVCGAHTADEASEKILSLIPFKGLEA